MFCWQCTNATVSRLPTLRCMCVCVCMLFLLCRSIVPHWFVWIAAQAAEALSTADVSFRFNVPTEWVVENIRIFCVSHSLPPPPPHACASNSCNVDIIFGGGGQMEKHDAKIITFLFFLAGYWLFTCRCDPHTRIYEIDLATNQDFRHEWNGAGGTELAAYIKCAMAKKRMGRMERKRVRW